MNHPRNMGPRVPGPVDVYVAAVLSSVAGVIWLAYAGWFTGPFAPGYLVVIVLLAAALVGWVWIVEGDRR